MFQITTAIRKIAKLKKRIRAVQGGTAAGKTIGNLSYLIDLAQRDKMSTITSVVSESFPHLKRGAIRDFLSILDEQHYFKDERWNKSDFVYTFETGSKLEFFSADQPDKVRGPRRERLFINEAINIPFETFEQLEIRTKEFIFLDWNPCNEFWFEEYIKNREDCEHLILTYKDNEGLDESIIKTIEARKDRKNWWRVYGLGLVGEIEGRIYTGWQIIDDIPHEAKLVRYGLDFGYTNDETAIIACYYLNGGYILDELTYLKGLKNKQIADIILNQEQQVLVIADNSEPKSIQEIKDYGVNIIGSRKISDGKEKNYNKWAIEQVQNQKISVTKQSINLLREYRNYLWMTDKNGKSLNEPEDLWNHAMDAVKYAIVSIVNPIKRTGIYVYKPQKAGFQPILHNLNNKIYIHKPK